MSTTRKSLTFQLPHRASQPLVPLESPFDFLDLFTIKSKSCFLVLMPETLILEETDSHKYILSNSMLNGKTLVLLSRPVESVKGFFRKLKEKTLNQIKRKPVKKLKFAERVYKALKRFTQFKPVAVIRLTDGRKIPVCSGELDDYQRNRIDLVRFIQEYIHLARRGVKNSHETFYCEYSNGLFGFRKKSSRYADARLNPSSKYYVPGNYRELKSLVVQDRFAYNNHLAGFGFYCSLFQALIDYDYPLEKTLLKTFRRPDFQPKVSIDIYNCFDQALNAKLSQTSKALINFINSRNLEVSKVSIKYLYNPDDHQLYFIGLRDLIIIPKAELAKFPDLKDLTLREIEDMKHQLDPILPISTPKLPNPTKTSINCSKKLALILRSSNCCGDFCGCVFGNFAKGGLEELEEANCYGAKELSGLLREDFSQQSFEISTNLLQRARGLTNRLPELFQKYKITNKGNNNNDSVKFRVRHKNEYRLVKVCRNCYLIYSLLTREFEPKDQKILNPLLKKTSKESISKMTGNELRNASLGLGFSSRSFSLNKCFFYPERKQQKQQPKSYINQTINLYKNTMLTRKGEVSLDGMFLDKTSPNAQSSALRSPARESLFGNPGRKSFLIAPEIIKYNYSPNLCSPKNSGSSPFKKSFTTSFDGGFSLASLPKRSTEKTQTQARHSTFVNKKLANLPTYQIHKILNRRKFFPLSGDASLTHSLFHRTFNHLRKLPHFRMSTPKLSLLDGKKGLEEKEHSKINIQGVSNLLGLDPPISSESIQVLVLDASTAIPYILLYSPKAKEVKHKEVLIVCHDFFDDFIGKIRFYQGLIRDLENYCVVLFNYPSQPYSLYSPDACYNNEILSQCLDLLIYELVRSKTFHLRSDNLRFLGFGLGCNVILHFLASSNSAINTLKACLLFNCFLYLDEPFNQFLKSTIRFLSEKPESDFPDLLFSAFANKSLDPKQETLIDPKTFNNAARATMLKGCLELDNISQTMENIEKVTLIFANSTQNTLISYAQKSSLERFTTIPEIIKFPLSKSKRFSFQIPDSGYNVFLDNSAKVQELILGFLKAEIPLNIEQRIAFIDKLLLIIEQELRAFYTEEVESFPSTLESSEFFHSIAPEQFPDIESEFFDAIAALLAIRDKIEALSQKIEKVSTVFQENKGELQERADDLVSKIINIQQKKINEFSKYLQTIRREIETPMKKEMRLLKGRFTFLRLLEEIRVFKVERLEILLGVLSNSEISDDMIRELRVLSQLKRQMNKKTRKYWGLTEESEAEIRNLQIFIEETGKEFKEIKEKVEDSIKNVLKKAENGDKKCLDLIKVIEQNYISSAEQDERKIDLMNFGKRESLSHKEIRTHIEKISKGLKGSGSPIQETPKSFS